MTIKYFVVINKQLHRLHACLELPVCEAGTGAAAIVYATAQTKEPISQGFVALLETFLTGILCLFTSCAIVFSGVLDHTQIGQISGIELASNAFQSVIPFFPIILSIIAVLFAISTFSASFNAVIFQSIGLSALFTSGIAYIQGIS